MSAASKLIRMVTRKKSKPKRKYKKSRTDRVRQDEGNTASDLMTPATASTPDSSGTKILVGTGEPNSPKIRESAVIAKSQNNKGKALTRKIRKREVYEKKRDSKTGKDKIKFIANNSQEQELLMASIKNMKDKDIVPKKKGGTIVKKNMGGSLKAVNNPGLAKLPTPVRNKMGYAKGGGKVKGYKKGGSITYRMSGGQVVGHGYD